VSLWAALAGGFLGTIVLTTTLRAGSELRLTRMDLPFLLGTALTGDRLRAKAIGYVLHFFFGQLFAVGYFFLFLALGRAGWLLGSAFGLAHGLFAGSALVNVLLPLVHPRMGNPMSQAGQTSLLEAPGFLMRNYGRQTPVVNLVAHVAYGAIVGSFVGFGAS
jgi:hypothetical protein